MKRKVRQDLYIKVLKFISENDNEASMNEIYDGLKLNETERTLIINNLLCGIKVIDNIGKRTDGSDVYTLAFEGNLRLLSYLELEQAKKASKCALWMAIIAMVLNLVAILSEFIISGIIKINL